MKTYTYLFMAATVAMSAASTVGAQGYSDDAIKIGLITGMTGVSAANGGEGSVVAAQIAIDEAGGKVGETPVVLLTADHQNKPDIGVSIAKKWIDQDKVDVMVDISNSAIGIAIGDLSRASKVLALYSESNSSKITGEACSPNGVQWSFNTYATANMVAKAAVEDGVNSWFFITSELEYGKSLQADATRTIEALGGEVLGSVTMPLGATDASSLILQARSSGADGIAIATPGFDTATVVKQIAEYGIRERGQKVIGLGISYKEVESLGLEAANGVLVGEAYYWDLNDEARAFADEFKERHGSRPSMWQASVYSSVKQYLEAAKAAGTDDGDVMMAAFREMTIHDAFIENGKIREDGQLIHDMYLFRVKEPGHSEGPEDLYELVATVPGDEAFQSLEDSACPLLAK